MIRVATKEDVPALKKIYNDAVLHTTATFDKEIKDDANRMEWLKEHELDPYILMVEIEDTTGVVMGYASLSRYRERPAFNGTVEVSVYIDEAHQGKGVGSRLMEAVLDKAKANPKVHVVVSLITGDNATSIHLHEKFGFIHAGTFHEVGYKFDQWLDLKFFELPV